jgi:IS30 family transposase
LDDREEISRGIVEGVSNAEVARRIGRDRSTVGREINNNGGREKYRAVAAHRAALERAKRPKLFKFEQFPLLALVVAAWLEFEQWSPEQISARLTVEFPDDETMRVTPETIYRALYVHGRGGLRKELTAYLRTQRVSRRSRQSTIRNRNQSSIPGLVSIAERPEEIEDRLVPGHWEGDLIMGRNSGSQVGTLVERTTGLVMLSKLDSKQADHVADAISERILTLPAMLRGSLTWDRGTEMAGHASITLATDMKVYFCDPHAPWQRGSNENINGLLRQYLPRDADLSQISQTDLDAIAHKLNTRPRKRHSFLTPLEVFDQLVLH